MLGEEPLRVLKIFLWCLPYFVYINKWKEVASRQMDRNCSVLANNLWEMLLKATGQTLASAERV
jgi:hypothetical protein